MIDLLDQDAPLTDSPVNLDLGQWQEEHNEWLSNFQTWKSIIGDTSESEGVELNFDPSSLWSDSLVDWSDSFIIYNTTYYGICTTTGFVITSF